MIDLKFHHIGIITRDIEKCSDSFLNLSIVTNFGGYMPGGHGIAI